MEKGFYHPSMGYWQTTGTPSEETLGKYPSGTVEVPLKPGPNHVFVSGQWVAQAAPAMPKEQVDALRRQAYRKEADPLFFKARRGEATEQEWLDKIAEIKTRYPS